MPDYKDLYSSARRAASGANSRARSPSQAIAEVLKNRLTATAPNSDPDIFSELLARLDGAEAKRTE